MRCSECSTQPNGYSVSNKVVLSWADIHSKKTQFHDVNEKISIARFIHSACFCGVLSGVSLLNYNIVVQCTSAPSETMIYWIHSSGYS